MNGYEEYKGKERREGLYIKIELKEWVEEQFKTVNKKLAVLDELPCKTNEGKIITNSKQIILQWGILGVFVLGSIIVIIVQNIFK